MHRRESPISVEEARRIALAAQGFDRARPARAPKLADLRRVLRQLGLVQIDCVNVVEQAHYQVPFSRLGPYDRSLLDELVYRKYEYLEQWAHEASIVPVEIWPLLGHRREALRWRGHGCETFLARFPEYPEWVLDQVRKRGPLAAGDLGVPDEAARRIPGSWWGSVPRAVLESHFGLGVLAVAHRRQNFTRVFDLAERIVPDAHRSAAVERDHAQRELLRRAARAHGIGTAADLADYYRMPVGEARPRLAELVEAGELLPVRVAGWREGAFLHREARVPARIEAASLLSPFDPVVWYRPRIARLFDFEYRMEVFVPDARRRWGPYVLPFLLGDRLVARVDLKADRSRRRLLVPAAFLESHADPGPVAEALARELRTLAGWLGLESVAVGRRGDFARRLRAVMRLGRTDFVS
ncbi:MAG TPA: crosslink repair DNA glycosylase YcaQ family protein [Bryobacteraceae bacterium]|nr:crosslink repair DNA glycosylase YcaQ family protein [Bryobacteraceae bacterium]